MQAFSELASWPQYRRICAEEFGVRLEQDPTERFAAIRGHRVRIDEWAEAGPRRGTLVLVHGGGGNGRILAPFAEPLAQAGWRVLAPDLPGFGLTVPAPGFDWDYAEWPAVIAELAAAQSGPVALMGLSMGGMTALFAARQSANVAAVIVTTLLDLSDTEIFVRAARWRWLGRLSLAGMALAPALFDRVRMPLSLATPLAAMSSSPRMTRFFKTDPLIGASWKPARFFRMVHAYTPRPLRLECPLLLVHPGADTWTPAELSLAVFDRIESPKEFVELNGGAHLPLEQPAYRELVDAAGKFLDRVAA